MELQVMRGGLNLDSWHEKCDERLVYNSKTQSAVDVMKRSDLNMIAAGEELKVHEVEYLRRNGWYSK